MGRRLRRTGARPLLSRAYALTRRVAAVFSLQELAMLDLALEEKLDELDPLRHLRDDPDLDSEGYTNSDSIVPAQPPSILDQTIELTFPHLTNGEASGGYADVSIRLVVDASPGCGGIAWPAGEVRSPCCGASGGGTDA